MKLNGITLEQIGKWQILGYEDNNGYQDCRQHTVYQMPNTDYFYIHSTDTGFQRVYLYRNAFDIFVNEFSVVPPTSDYFGLECTSELVAGLYVWVDGNTCWNKVYLINNKLYLRYGRSSWDRLDNHRIDKIEHN